MIPPEGAGKKKEGRHGNTGLPRWSVGQRFRVDFDGMLDDDVILVL